MPYKYKIEVAQLSKRNNYEGEIQSLNEINLILKQVEKTLLKDELAKVTFTYTEINEEKKNLERAKIKKIVEEEFAKANDKEGKNMLETKICPLCKRPYVGYGNNPSPFNEKECCDACNGEYVIPLRAYLINENPKYALRFKTNGKIEMLRPRNEYFTLEELQEAVGGMIELYPDLYHDKLIICDEEGLIKQSRSNKLFESLTSFHLVGDVVLCPKEIFEEPDE